MKYIPKHISYIFYLTYYPTIKLSWQLGYLLEDVGDGFSGIDDGASDMPEKEPLDHGAWFEFNNIARGDRLVHSLIGDIVTTAEPVAGGQGRT
ncbi:MAG: hypothetical protein JJ891_04410 [Rhizobiaceae bacterium]|nr:hypothetical protein [Rhizobiaceae bacterium]